jgi:mycothiol synthase
MVRPFRPDDASEVHQLHARHAAADLVDIRSTIEPVLDTHSVRRRMMAAEWAVVAVDRAGSLIGWGSLASWTEADKTRVYLTDGYVAPPARRRGLGRQLLREAEATAAQLAAARSEEGTVVLGGNASAVQRDRAALLEHAGYRQVFTMVEMEHDGSPVKPRRLPDDVVVRPAAVADARSLAALTAQVWSSRPFFTPPAEEQLRDWLRRSDLAWFQVATVGDRIVAFVAASRTPGRNEIEDVQVDPDFQRRGLATALLTRTLAMLAEQGANTTRLHTEGQDPAGARSLYERLGFRVVREHRRYRKSLNR